LPPLKGGHIDLTEQNKEIENAKVSEEIVETQDVSSESLKKRRKKKHLQKETTMMYQIRYMTSLLLIGQWTKKDLVSMTILTVPN